MWNYEHEQFNSKTSSLTCNSPIISLKRNKEHNSQDLELEDTTSLKHAQLMKFMRNYGNDTTRLDGLHNMELMNSFSYLLSQNLVQING